MINHGDTASEELAHMGSSYTRSGVRRDEALVAASSCDDVDEEVGRKGSYFVGTRSITVWWRRDTVHNCKPGTFVQSNKVTADFLVPPYYY